MFLDCQTAHAVQLVIVEGLQQILRFLAIKLRHPSVPPPMLSWAGCRNFCCMRQGDFAAIVLFGEGETLPRQPGSPAPRLSRGSSGHQRPEKGAPDGPPPAAQSWHSLSLGRRPHRGFAGLSGRISLVETDAL